MAVKKLTENTKVDVYNNTTHDLGYYVEGLKRREWKYGANPIVKIPLGEIENALGDIGCYNMFSNSKLLIRDEDVREYLGLQPLEGVLTNADVKEILQAQDIDRVIEELQTAKNEYNTRILDAFVDLAIELRVTDFSILGNIKEYTGKDVEEFVKDAIETDRAKQQKAKK